MAASVASGGVYLSGQEDMFKTFHSPRVPVRSRHDPLQFIGRVQPHGVLLAIRASDLTITHISENSLLHLGWDPLRVLNQPIKKHIDFPSLVSLEKFVKEALTNRGNGPSALEMVTMPGRKRWTGIVHRSHGSIILELETPDSSSQVDSWEIFRELTAASELVQKTRSIEELCGILADSISKVTQYDRVMIYRFDQNEDGEVVAEVISHPDVTSFLGLSFPAADIPPRARAMFFATRFRIIGDIEYDAANIMCSQQDSQLDLSNSTLRAVSACHIQYLRNMHVRATLTNAIVVHDKLWGIIACHHHRGPKFWNYKTRAAFAAFGQVVASHLAFLEELESRTSADHVRDLHIKLADLIGEAKDYGSVLTKAGEDLRSVIPSIGAAILTPNNTHATGITPTADMMSMIVQSAGTLRPGDVWHTDRISRFLPEEENGIMCKGIPICGVLLLCLMPDHYIMWFRPEVSKTRRWAGKTDTPLEGDELLQPRASFDLWLENVKGVSEPFPSHEEVAAQSMRAVILDINFQLNRREMKAKEELILDLTKKLAGSTDRFRGELNSLMDSVPLMVFTLDLAGAVSDWNSIAHQVTGFTKPEILGQVFVQKAVGYEFQHAVECAIDRAVRGLPNSEVECTIRPPAARSQQTPHPRVLVRFALWKDSEDNEVGLLAIGTEIFQQPQSSKGSAPQASIAPTVEPAVALASTLVPSAQSALDGPVKGTLEECITKLWTQSASSNGAEDSTLALLQQEIRPFIEDLREMLESAFRAEDPCEAKAHVADSLDLLNKMEESVVEYLEARSSKAAFSALVFDVRRLIDAAAFRVNKRALLPNKLALWIEVSSDVPLVKGDPIKLQHAIVSTLTCPVMAQLASTQADHFTLRVSSHTVSTSVVEMKFEMRAVAKDGAVCLARGDSSPKQEGGDLAALNQVLETIGGNASFDHATGVLRFTIPLLSSSSSAESDDVKVEDASW